jgi:L-threonylcarbamoyladenylate synthase
LKGREADKPFPLIVGSVEQLLPLVGGFSNFVQKIMDIHWPGPLTLVMDARPGAHPRLLSDNNGIGMRLSSWPMASALSNALDKAITATSANLAGGTPAQTIDQLDPAVAEAVDIILDGGPTPGGQASTVLDVRVLSPRGAAPRPCKHSRSRILSCQTHPFLRSFEPASLNSAQTSASLKNESSFISSAYI